MISVRFQGKPFNITVIHAYAPTSNAVEAGLITSWQIDGEAMEIVTDFILGALKSLQMVTVAMKPEDIYFLVGKL